MRFAIRPAFYSQRYKEASIMPRYRSVSSSFFLAITVSFLFAVNSIAIGDTEQRGPHGALNMEAQKSIATKLLPDREMIPITMPCSRPLMEANPITRIWHVRSPLRAHIGVSG